MVGRVTPTILAMDAFETCFCRRTRISSSLPSSRDFPNDGKIRKRVLVLTEGVMVRICRLLEAAAIQAIETEHEHINFQTLTDDLTTETLVSISDRRSRRTAN
jgi:hypothetical protein